MSPELIKEALKAKGRVNVKHIKSNTLYILGGVLKTKINGKWVEAVTYSGRTGKFCRLISDFEGFEYLFNEEVIR